MPLKKSDFEKICRELLNTPWGVLSWKRDYRFEAFPVKFSTDKREEYRAMLERVFSNIWDSSTIGEAPAIVKMRNNEFGGPRSDHLFFFLRPEPRYFYLCWLVAVGRWKNCPSSYLITCTKELMTNNVSLAYLRNQALLSAHENDPVLNKSFDGCRFFEIFDVTLDFSFFLFIL